MIALLVLSLILAAATFLGLRRLTTSKRLVWAMAVFTATFVLPLCYILLIGDRAPQGSQVVAPDDVSPGAR